VHLRYARPFLRAQRRAAQRRKVFEATFVTRGLRSFECQVAIVDWLNAAAFVFFDVAAADDPIAPQLGKTFTDIRAYRWITVWAGGVVDAHCGVFFQLVLEIARRVLIDFAEGYADAALLAFNVAATRVWKFSIT